MIVRLAFPGFPVGAVLRFGMLKQHFFRLAKAGGDTAQRAIRTDMAVPAHPAIGRHRPARRLFPAAKIAVNVTRGADHRFPLSLCRLRLSGRNKGKAFNGVLWKEK